MRSFGQPWSFGYQRAGGSAISITSSGGGLADMSLIKNQAGQNFTFGLLNVTNGTLLTGGLHNNIAGQHVTFGMVSAASVADPSATVTVKISKDGSSLVTGAGTV